jgi:hypothetical protein
MDKVSGVEARYIMTREIAVNITEALLGWKAMWGRG